MGKKSVYSLVLMDDVVEAIDRMAYSMNTSRSNLINQILAQKVSLVTPEMRMKDIFSYLEEFMKKECFQIQNQASDSMFSVRSSLQYKYRPTVRYLIELYREPSKVTGMLKVSLRTSSESLLHVFECFFQRWVQMENYFLEVYYPEGIPCKIETGKYSRGFLKQEENKQMSAQEIAAAIGDYIKILDQSIKIYFDSLEEEKVALYEIQLLYQEYRKTESAIL